MAGLHKEGRQLALHIFEDEIGFLRRIKILEVLVIHMALCVGFKIACPMLLGEARYGVLEVFERLLWSALKQDRGC